MNHIEESYQLSPMQQGMLFHSLYAPQSGVDIEQMIIGLHESLNVSAFELAWQRIIERHPILRTGFRLDDLDEPLQDVYRQVNLSLEQHDWRDISDQEQEKRLETYLQSDRHKGFKLTEAPLMRLALVRIGEADYQCVWTFHHVLLDGRSFPIVLKEVFAFYEALCQGQDLQLKRPLPYRDYIEWLQQQDWSGAESFWRKSLSGFAVSTPLIVDRVHKDASGQKKDHGKQEIHLSEAVTSALKSLAQQHQLTLNTLVQGAWAVLLSRYSGEQEVVFGATRACRRSTVEGAQAMVGVFINTLPVRVQVPPEMPVLAWLKELRAQHITIRAYEHTPLTKIQKWSDMPGGMPLFESILVFENYSLNFVLREQGGSWTNREFRLLEQTNYPLTVAGYLGTELLLRIGYDRGRFEDATVTRMLGHLKTLLEGMAANPEKQLLALPLLPEKERHQILVEWNDTRTSYPQDQCIHQLFEAQVERTPDDIALVFKDDQLTYQELNSRANQLAHRLQALGVEPEVLIGICMERSLEMVVGLLGILKAGGAYVPLDPVYPKERLQFMIKDSGIDLILTQKKLTKLVKSLGDGQVVLLDSTDHFPESIVNDNNGISHLSGVRPDNLAYVIYTSGSTGFPKGVVVEHQSVVNLISFRTTKLFNKDELRVVPFQLSISFDGSVSQLFVPLSVGSKIIMVENLPSWYFHPQVNEITCVNLVPSALEALLNDVGLPNSLQVVGVGAEMISEKLVQELRDHPQVKKIINVYGPTEATVNCSSAVLFDRTVEELRDIPDDRSHSVEPRGRQPITIGKPIQNLQIYLLDKHLQPVPVGVPGELHVGGVGLARGYLNRPELTDEKFIPNPFSQESGARLYKTGDLARYLPDGNIEFLGRIDHQVKIRGFRVELGEIEMVLSQHPAVQKNVILAREDHTGNKRLVAYVVSSQEPAPTISELRKFLKQKLPEYMIPSAVVILDNLPLNPNGKVDRRALPAPDLTRPELETAHVAPQNEVEQFITEVWRKVLHLDRVGMYDNFFDLGGHSLLLVQVFSELQRFFKQELTMVDMFKYPTVRDLAGYLSQKNSYQGSLSRSNDSIKNLNKGKDRLKQLYKRRRQIIEKQQKDQDE